MDAKTRRLMKSKQGKTVTGSGNLLASEGKSGDIQARMTSKGPKLFVKLGNKWMTADLKNIEEKANVFIPQVWFWRGLSPANGTNLYLYLPDYINNSTILGISVGISLGSYERTHFSLGTSGATAIYKMFVNYNKQHNYVRIQNLASSGTRVQNKYTNISVFFR